MNFSEKVGVVNSWDDSSLGPDESNEDHREIERGQRKSFTRET